MPEYYAAELAQTFDEQNEPCGLEPCVPPAWEILELCNPRAFGGGIFQVGTLDPDTIVASAELPRCRPLPKDAAAIIDSATAYPPALAIARSRVERRLAGSPGTLDELIAAFSAAVDTAMAEQDGADFILARVLDDGGDFDLGPPGAWTWVVAADPDRDLVWWVSSDFFIYTAPQAAFELDARQIQRLADVARAAATRRDTGDAS